ncbi:hypothetical protein PDESU_01075 [Pontiella desulfatans]|uniref:Uncharacterized protein n=1 Tax=Pontiella desulfatans TaxID=2750659 RepID=A0A6C2TY26_PONDE|nr:hypothetical protein [Pontiella desulfatans]VGO12522.1 hypothetical protein PDESU_01075 [Pontiella desulfatans]
MKSRTMQAVAVAVMAACVVGANAQTTTNATPTDSHVLQGNFQVGGLPVFLANNSNADRCGTGGATGQQRVNQAIFSFDLPSIPAGETVNAATFSFKMFSTAVNGAPLEFDMVLCLMDHDDIGDFSGADFVEATAPINSPLTNGVVIAQLAVADVSNNETIDVSLTGAALAQLAGLYDGTGTPSQSKLWFRASTSTNIDTSVADNANDRFNFDDAGHTGPNISGLELDWGIPSPDIYYVATTPTNWTVGAAWSDGNPAAAGDDYYVTNGVALQTPSATATFPGDALVLEGSQTVELMASGADVITFPSLDLSGDTLRAGVVDSGEAKVDGTLNVIGNSSFGGATDSSRDLRVLALVTGSSTVTLSAPGKTIYIEHAGNTFDGTWNLTGNYAEFASPAAVGAGSIQVGNFGKLRILGDWDGLATDETLTVADSANAVVEVGSYAWKVSALTFGGSNVVDGAVYTTAELNAMGTNAVFTGAGTIQVGTPPPPPPGELIAGWDSWSSGTAPTVTVVKAGITASATATGTGGDWTIGDTETDPGRGSSVDGTWGTYDGGGNPPNTVTNEHGANMTLTNGKTDGEITFTITNSTASAINLGSVHFDALAFRPNAARTYAVNVLAGSDITVGNVFTSPDDAITEIAGSAVLLASRDAHDDIDVSLAGLADSTLEVGEVAIVQLAFSSGTGSGGGHHLFIDNVGFSAAASTGPVEPPVMESDVSGGNVTLSWASDGAFKLQTRPNLVVGDWADVPGATSSPVVVPATNAVEFLRLIEQ